MPTWRLNNENLNVADVETFPTRPLSVSRQQRSNRQPTQEEKSSQPREGGQEINAKGWDLPRLTITFELVGKGEAVTDELEFIVNEIETNQIITLEAPSDIPAHVYLNQKRAPLFVESYDNDASEQQAVQKITLQCSVLGQWTQDSGGFCEEQHGHFLQTDSTPTYEREDGSTQGDLTITLDEQDDGYPEAKNPSTLAWDTLSPISTGSRTLRDGRIVETETYDLSGYLFPSDPSTTGDAGLFKICQSPTFGVLFPVTATVQSGTTVEAISSEPVDATATVASGSTIPTAKLLQIRASSATVQSATAVDASMEQFAEDPIGATVQSDSDVTADPTQIFTASATVQSDSTVDATARNVTQRATATIQSDSDVTPDIKHVIQTMDASVVSATDVTVVAEVGTFFTGSATTVSGTTVDPTAIIRRTADSTIDSGSTVDASASVIREASATTTSSTTLSPGVQILSDLAVDEFENIDLAAYSGDT